MWWLTGLTDLSEKGNELSRRHDMSHIYVIGRHGHMARDYIRAKHLQLDTHSPLASAQTLRGLREPSVILVGNYREREDWPELSRLLDERKARVLKREMDW
jgi:hypothetical protein